MIAVMPPLRPMALFKLLILAIEILPLVVLLVSRLLVVVMVPLRVSPRPVVLWVVAADTILLRSVVLRPVLHIRRPALRLNIGILEFSCLQAVVVTTEDRPSGSTDGCGGQEEGDEMEMHSGWRSCYELGD